MYGDHKPTQAFQICLWHCDMATKKNKISGKNGKVNTNGAEQRFLVRLILENKLCFYFSLFYHFCCCCFFLPLNVILVDCQGIWEMQTCRDTHTIFWLTYIYAHCLDSTLRSNSFIKFFLFLHSCGVNSLWMRDVTEKQNWMFHYSVKWFQCKTKI